MQRGAFEAFCVIQPASQGEKVDVTFSASPATSGFTLAWDYPPPIGWATTFDIVQLIYNPGSSVLGYSTSNPTGTGALQVASLTSTGSAYLVIPILGTDAYGNTVYGAPSNVILPFNFRQRVSGPPAAPTAIGNPPFPFTTLQPGLLWWQDNSNDETGFEIQREPLSTLQTPGATPAWQTIATVPADTTSYQDTSNSFGYGTSDWAYQVIAFNAAGYSQPSAAILSPHQDYFVQRRKIGVASATNILTSRTVTVAWWCQLVDGSGRPVANATLTITETSRVFAGALATNTTQQVSTNAAGVFFEKEELYCTGQPIIASAMVTTTFKLNSRPSVSGSVNTLILGIGQASGGTEALLH